MKIAVMQPYFFPYIGYYQLINEVDKFVFFDDVNFKKRSWITRNYILTQGHPQRLTLGVRGGSQNKLINEISLGEDNNNLLKTIYNSYSKAPYFNNVFPILKDIFASKESSLSRFLEESIVRISEYLQLNTEWEVSSNIYKGKNLKGKDKILTICNELGATSYVNLPGGKGLYDKEFFKNNGIDLEFINTKDVKYTQFGNEFVPNLSILDVLMFNSQEECEILLPKYSID